MVVVDGPASAPGLCLFSLMIPVEGEDLFPVTTTKYPRAGYPGCGWGHVPIHEPVSVAGGRDGCSDWPGLGQGLCRAGALGSSPKENLELFSEMGEVDARQQKQQLSRKEGSTLRNEGRNQGCVPLPRQKGVGARDLAPSQKDAARAQKLGLHLVFFSSSLLVSRWKASQGCGGAGEAESQI